MKRYALMMVVMASCAPTETKNKSDRDLPSPQKIFGTNENGSEAKAGEPLNEYLRRTGQTDRRGTDFIR